MANSLPEKVSTRVDSGLAYKYLVIVEIIESKKHSSLPSRKHLLSRVQSHTCRQSGQKMLQNFF